MLFKDSPPVARNETKFKIVPEFGVDFFCQCTFVETSRSIPELFGGGPKAVETANAHSDRETILVWLVISIFLFLILMPKCLINCCCVSIEDP